MLQHEKTSKRVPEGTQFAFHHGWKLLLTLGGSEKDSSNPRKHTDDCNDRYPQGSERTTVMRVVIVHYLLLS
jgi:hypothetical protein